jgi:Tfp pilus assembly protein PilX
VTHRRRQRGMALVVGLIMLTLMTLLAITSFNIGRTSLEIVANMQQNAGAIRAANSAIEEAISTTRLFESPDSVFLTPCAGANTRCYNLYSDDPNDGFTITVALTPKPVCVQAQKLLNANLDVKNGDDFGCITGAGQVFGIEGVKSGESLCANSVWEINAVATDPLTQTQATVTEGAAVRVSSAIVETSCPD